MKVGNPATGDDFFGREQELRDVWQHLEHDHLTLPGVRRLGKTSLMIRITEQASAKGVLAKRLDVSHITKVEQFLELIDQSFPAAGITHFLSEKKQAASNWLSRLKQVEFQLPEIFGGGGVSVALNARPDIPWGAQALALQQRLQNQPLLLLIDEFPVLLERLLRNGNTEAEQLLIVLRQWRQQGNWRFVFTGSIGLQSLLESYRLTVHMNDCYEFPLGPMRKKEATAMWCYFADKQQWTSNEELADTAMSNLGWCSPYYICWLLDETMRAARIRYEETGLAPADGTIACGELTATDLETAYQYMLNQRSRFIHWKQRLSNLLVEPELGFCLALLTLLSREPDGFTLQQLNQRLSAHEINPDKRADLLQKLIVRLNDEGYISQPNEKGCVQFLAFPLRDWWSRNHVGF
ncbi:hypothetical protein [Rheinheimera texasensis]|uniref:hypothetical protein n=1 Tax=Rheinheimera texasensis TaxID=306205 RepID=UPI0032B156F4